MPEFELAADASNKVQDAREPIKRVVERSEKPNPLLPALEASWAARTKRNGSTDTETGSTKSYRSYSGPETLAVIRALRRGSDKLDVGVRIVAPETRTPKTDKDGQPVYVLDKDGNPRKDKVGNPIQRESISYRAGTVIFETHTRQKRARSTDESPEDSTTDAPEDAPEDESTDDQDAGEDGADATDQTDQENEPAWQS